MIEIALMFFIALLLVCREILTRFTSGRDESVERGNEGRERKRKSKEVPSKNSKIERKNQRPSR